MGRPKRNRSNHPRRTPRRVFNPGWSEAFAEFDDATITRLLGEGYTWFSMPTSAMGGVECQGHRYTLPPLETVRHGVPVQLVLLQEEAAYPFQFDIEREMGLLVEESASSRDKFLVYPALVPSERVPSEHRGHLVSLTSPGFALKQLSVVRPVSCGTKRIGIIDGDHWWLEAGGAAVENALSLVYLAAYVEEVA